MAASKPMTVEVSLSLALPGGEPVAVGAGEIDVPVTLTAGDAHGVCLKIDEDRMRHAVAGLLREAASTLEATA